MTGLDALSSAMLMDNLTAIATAAAQAILKLAADAGAVQIKADGSPATRADTAAEALILEALHKLAPTVPVISEERASQERPTVPQRGRYFLVDPLDGTREFIAGRNEYTVNIALMADGAPTAGVICTPVTGEIWRGIVGEGAERLHPAEPSRRARIQARPQPVGEIVIMASRSHLDARTGAYMEKFPHRLLVQCGSSVKFCRLAEGTADIYPRLAPTHDWDIAAGHAILTAAGGEVRAPDGSPLRYGTLDLLIPEFIATGRAATD